MKRVILVHGFNVADGGKQTIGRLKPYIRERWPDAEIVEFTTDWKRGLFRDLITVRFRNGKRAKKLASIIREGDLLIGHSNGCALLSRALWDLASLCKCPQVDVAFFNPALDKDTPLAPQVSKCWVFWTPTDETVGVAKKLLFHEWGEMGKTGYVEAQRHKVDSRYTNCNYEEMGFPHLEHSGVFANTEAMRECLARIFSDLKLPL